MRVSLILEMEFDTMVKVISLIGQNLDVLVSFNREMTNSGCRITMGERH